MVVRAGSDLASKSGLGASQLRHQWTHGYAADRELLGAVEPREAPPLHELASELPPAGCAARAPQKPLQQSHEGH